MAMPRIFVSPIRFRPVYGFAIVAFAVAASLESSIRLAGPALANPPPKFLMAQTTPSRAGAPASGTAVRRTPAFGGFNFAAPRPGARLIAPAPILRGRTFESGSTPKREPRPDRVVIVCTGGSLVGRQCICPGSRTKQVIGRNAFACRDRTPGSNLASNDSTEECAVGTRRKGRCQCPSGKRVVGGVCKTPDLSPPVVVTIDPPLGCAGGRVRNGRCRCPAGRQFIDGACKAPDASPPVIVTPETPRGGERNAGVPRSPRPGPGPIALPPRAQIPQVRDQFVADQILVTLPTSAPPTIEDDVARDYGLALLGRFTMTLLDARIVRYRIPDGRTIAAVVAALQADPRVRDPQPNYLFYRVQAEAPRVQASELQYALAKINVTSAHTLASGRGAVVAVIDSRIDAGHPDLANAIDDVFDAVGDGDTKPDSHGTAIAGIIRAQGTVQGIAPQAKLLSVRAFAPATNGRASAATSYVVLRGLEWSMAQGARVLNMSFAGPRDPLLGKAVRAAYEKRAIIVASAGNGGPAAPPAFPAAYEEVIAVTATDAAERLYQDANRGHYIAIAAPGVDILAPSTGRAHQLQSGTSFAAAHVSGIIALMLERSPRLTAEEARRVLMDAAKDLGRPGRDQEFGAGNANAYGALRMLERQRLASP